MNSHLIEFIHITIHTGILVANIKLYIPRDKEGNIINIARAIL